MGPKSRKHMLLLRSRRDATALPQGMRLLTAQMTSHEKHLQAFLAGKDCSEPWKWRTEEAHMQEPTLLYLVLRSMRMLLL